MKKGILEFVQGDFHLKNYDEEVAKFDWKSVEKNFTWSETGKMNLAHECIDRHARSDRKDKIALHYKSDNRKESYTYEDLRIKSNQAANMFRKCANVQKGDRVFLFMPRSPELYFAALGAIKLGAIVGPLFEAFMESAVRDRLENSEASVLVTIPSMIKRIPFEDLPYLRYVFVVAEEGERIPGITIDFKREMAQAGTEFEVEWVQPDNSYILHYTSGSTGKPKGVLHAHNAMIQQYQTGKWVLDLHEEDIYWCTADPGWVTGTGEEAYKDKNLSSLRHILSVGEPLNPEVVRWGWDSFGVRIHDTWWMTETGSQTICNFPSMTIRPGSMGKPIPGIIATILDDNGNELPPGVIGNLAIKKGWPSMMRGIWKSQEKFNSYFVNDEWYVSGDSAYKDEDGYFWFQGRVDDCIMTAGERVGPFEVESTLLEHPAVAEAGVIGKPDVMRGEVIKAFVALKNGYAPTPQLKNEISYYVKMHQAAHAYPKEIEFIEKIPKTRSGKIMRRVLKAMELGLPVGDISTMED
ncbi:MAG: acetate--CoA ligase [Bacillales bacterium]|nr:acetate--CoA ligase [Bacillales bacterium]